MIKSYVINLERRPDRLKTFRHAFDEHMPKGLPLEVIKAVDGSVENFLYSVPEHLRSLVSTDNDYSEASNSHAVQATIYSHLKAWDAIAKGDDVFGFIFEDDAIFARTRELTSSTLINALSMYPSNSSILWFGCGDVLPGHFSHPSESMLRAQERSHVKVDLGGYGRPNFKSAYVFDWLGGFSYILSKEVAQKLLNQVKQQSINCAVDSWLRKNEQIEAYLTVPLLTYSTFEDSDTGRN